MIDHSSSIKFNRIYCFTLIAFAIITDQISKFVATSLLSTIDHHFFFNDIVVFKLVQNSDGFLGLFTGLSGVYRNFFLNNLVAILLVIGLFYLFSQKRATSLYHLSLALVVGGGISNLLDRMLYDGSVIDFISVGGKVFRTGIFNLADLYIVTGSFTFGYLFFSSLPIQNR